MTKCVATHKNMADGHEQEDAEEEATTSGNDVRTVRKLTGEATASGSDVRTVRKPTGETPGTHSIQNVTGTVMEERRVEETCKISYILLLVDIYAQHIYLCFI